ncbi:hypothetical protein K438DRAFT_1862123 [Mycena galopus ATCC 62051]|nr:hypothetical protein K438DRAFT_1862123 [Mycena galopus ATCC 62051]
MMHLYWLSLRTVVATCLELFEEDLASARKVRMNAFKIGVDLAAIAHTFVAVSGSPQGYRPRYCLRCAMCLHLQSLYGTASLLMLKGTQTYLCFSLWSWKVCKPIYCHHADVFCV